MNHIVERLKSDLNWYDETHSHNRYELIEETKEKFRLICEEYNNNGEYIIDGYTVGYGNLEINKNICGLIEILESKIMDTKNNRFIKDFQKSKALVEQRFQYSLLNRYIPAALSAIGSEEEIMENIAIYGNCHITLDRNTMSSLVNTHSMLMATFYCQVLCETDNTLYDDIPSILDVLEKYYSLESVTV